MQTKNAIGTRQTTVLLDGDVTAVDFGHAYLYYAVRNDGESSIYVSTENSKCAAGENGVISVPAGESYVHYNGYNGSTAIYVCGRGTAAVVAQDDANNPFKSAAKGGGNGEILNEKITEHTDNSDIHVTATDKDNWNGYADEIETNKTDISQLFDITKGGEIVSNESSYTISNAVDYPVLGLNLYGKSTQDGTPAPDNPVEIVSVGDSGSVGITACGKNLLNSTLKTTTQNGVTCTNNGDGTYTLDGTSTGNTSILLFNTVFFEEGKKYRLVGWNKSIIGVKNSLGIYVEGIYNFDIGSGSTFTVPHSKRYAIQLVYKSGYTFDNFVIKPMVTTDLSATYDDFEPYKGTTANITTALPLCGIPVSEGGNYTDKNGQQWICDEFVYNADGTGKIVKHTEKITYDDSYNIANFSILENCARFCIYNRNKPYTTEKSTKSICDFIPYMSSYNNDVPHHYMQDYAIWIFIPVAELSTQDITGVTKWLSEKQPTFVYRRVTPQEIPLSAAEMAELRQLRTYSGVTNITNSDGADMDVKYCTNKNLSECVIPITTALQAQINELKSAVLSLGGNV